MFGLYSDTSAALSAARFRTRAPSSSDPALSPRLFKSTDFQRLNVRARCGAKTGMDVAKCLCKRLWTDGEINDYRETKEKANMLWTILVILLVLWLLGLVSGVTVGGFIHLLLVLALVIFVINLLTGRRTV